MEELSNFDISQRQKLIEMISQKYAITKNIHESEEQFQYRVVYSALCKMLLANLDSDTGDLDMTKGVSNQLLRKNMLQLFEGYGFLFPKLSKKLDEKLYEEIKMIYIATGYIYDAKNRFEPTISTGTGTSVLTLFRGNKVMDDLKMSGGGIFTTKNTSEITDDLYITFGLQENKFKDIYQFLEQLEFDEFPELLNNEELQYLRVGNKDTEERLWWNDNKPKVDLSLARLGYQGQEEYYIYQNDKFHRLNDKIMRNKGYYSYRLAILKHNLEMPKFEYEEIDDLVYFDLGYLLPF